MKLNTKYSINDRVYIIPLKTWGRIISLFISNTGLSYNVRYFNNLKPDECYFIEEELSIEEPKKEVGFKINE